MPDDMEPFYNNVLSVEGHIFEECTVSWPQRKKTILKGLWNVAFALRGRLSLKFSDDHHLGGRGCCRRGSMDI